MVGASGGNKDETAPVFARGIYACNTILLLRPTCMFLLQLSAEKWMFITQFSCYVEYMFFTSISRYFRMTQTSITRLGHVLLLNRSYLSFAMHVRSTPVPRSRREKRPSLASVFFFWSPIITSRRWACELTEKFFRTFSGFKIEITHDFGSVNSEVFGSGHL